MFSQTKAQMLVALGVTLMGLLLFPGVALAHDLGFDSDLDENGIVQFANPQGIRPGLFDAAIDDWNQKVLSGIGKGPIFVDVTNNPDAFVEVIVDQQGGDTASFVARTVFTTHPDNIDLSARFANLSFEKKLGTVTHELGHTRGHAHTEAAYCSTSIMPTRGTCQNAGEVRLESVGLHDVLDTDALWNGPLATHPVPNKCWTNADANRDGVCDRFGPPPAETAETDPRPPAINFAGNVDPIPASSTLTAGAVVPDTTIDSGSSGATNDASPSFTFSGAGANGTYQCQLNNGGFAVCTSPKSYMNLADGSYTFEVKSTDEAGNTDTTPASRTWTVDTTAPTVDAVAPVNGANGIAVSANTEATFSEAMDASTVNGTTFKLTEQGSTSPVAATITYDSTTKTAMLKPEADLKAATTYTVTIKGGANGAMDTAGNALATDKVWSFTTADPADTIL